MGCHEQDERNAHPLCCASQFSLICARLGMRSSAEIHEVLACLAGFESSLFVLSRSSATHGLVVNPSYTGIHPGEVSILNKLAHLGYSCRCARSHVRKLSKSSSCIIRAVSARLNFHLNSFYDFVVQCEGLILQKTPDIVFENEVSLTRLLSMFMPHQKTMLHLLSVCEDLSHACAAKNPPPFSTVMDKLKAQTNTGFAAIQVITSDLLRAAELSWLYQLQMWCVFGTLHSQEQRDFFIKASDDAGFEFDANGIPDYIDVQVGEEIYKLGKLLNQLHEKVPIYSQASSEIALIEHHRTLIEGISLPLESEVIRAVIANIAQSLSQNVLKRLLPKAAIADLLELLRQYFLLENGEFAQLLVERAQDEFRSQKHAALGRLQSSTINAVLTRTISTLTLENDIEHEKCSIEPTAMYMSLLANQDQDQGGQPSFSDFLFGVSVSLNLRVDWPLDIFLSVEDLSAYQGYFDMLISLRRSQQLLGNLWRNRRQEMKRTRIRRSTWSTAFNAMYFLAALASHFHDRIVQEFSSALENMLSLNEETYDPERMSYMHREALKTLSIGLMTSNAPFRKVIRRLLSQIDVMLASIANDEQERTRGSCLILEHLILDAASSLTTEAGIDSLLLKIQTIQSPS